VTLTFDLLTLKVVSESRVTWATSVPISVSLGLSVLDLGPMYATDVVRQTSDRRQTKASLNASDLWGGGIKIVTLLIFCVVGRQVRDGGAYTVVQCL